MPDAAAAKEATGYERGTITPFGSTRPWPVVADEQPPEVPQVDPQAQAVLDVWVESHNCESGSLPNAGMNDEPLLALSLLSFGAIRLV